MKHSFPSATGAAQRRPCFVCPHLLEQEHDVDPEQRLLAHQGEAGFAVQAVVALQGTAEEQLCHTALNSVCREIHGILKPATNGEKTQCL